MGNYQSEQEQYFELGYNAKPEGKNGINNKMERRTVSDEKDKTNKNV